MSLLSSRLHKDKRIINTIISRTDAQSIFKRVPIRIARGDNPKISFIDENDYRLELKSKLMEMSHLFNLKCFLSPKYPFKIILQNDLAEVA